MNDLTAFQKELVAVFLAVGLLFVFAKVAYEHLTKEKFTLSNIIHPVKRITAKERHFIGTFLLPYQYFGADQKRAFLRRFSWFKSKRSFVFYGDIENKEEIKAYVTASAILLTMGMRDFRFEKSVSRIVVYPSNYYSRILKQHHIGEYNPKLKTLVFSAEDLKKGFQIPNDNLNLGIHEMAHALCFETKGKKSWEARRFQYGFRKLNGFFERDDFQEELLKKDFLREYGQENLFELFAVLTESFIENPKLFKQKHPQLYTVVRTMYNADFSEPNLGFKVIK